MKHYFFFHRECPDEAKEAISTLIFAAARFSDLPELCDLRRAFNERFGGSMESFVNSEVLYFSVTIQCKSKGIGQIVLGLEY